MKNPRKSNVSEYSALREETCTRIEIMNSQANSAFTTALATWVIGFTLLGLQFTSDSFPEDVMTLILTIGQIIAFFSAIILLLPMAAKSGENLRQLVSLAAYIRIFFDEASQVNSQDDFKFYWETMDKKMNIIINSNTKIRTSTVYDNIQKFSSKPSLFNSEYAALAIVSNAFFLLDCANFIFLLCELSVRIIILIIVCMILIAFEILAIYLIRKISQVSSGRLNSKESYRVYLKQYFELAMKYSVLDKEEGEQIWNDILKR